MLDFLFVGMSAEKRRLARASWETKVFRSAPAEEIADHDAGFWARIPIEERAATTWRLSEELYEIAQPGTRRRERRLPRSAFRPVRR